MLMVCTLALIVYGAKTVVRAIQNETQTAVEVYEESLAELVDTEEEEEEEEEEPQILIWTDDAFALLEEVETAVDAIEETGYDVGYIVIDVATGETIEYNADTTFYGASTIKGPYVVSLVQALGSDARAAYGSTIESCLVYSDNSAYTALKVAYASYTFFDEFLEEAGVDLDFVGDYAFFTPRELATMWAALATYLTSDDENAQWLGTLLADSLYSTVDDAALEGDVTFSKAGWYWGSGSAYDTTANGGLVVFESGSFAVAVMTTAPADFEAIQSVMTPLVALWEELYNEA